MEVFEIHYVLGSARPSFHKIMDFVQEFETIRVFYLSEIQQIVILHRTGLVGGSPLDATFAQLIVPVYANIFT